MLKNIYIIFAFALLATGSCKAPEVSTVEPAAQYAEDMRLYGASLRNLSFQQVKAILLDDKIYEGVMNPDLFRMNGIYTPFHPYGLPALVNRITSSTATDDEKQTLWAILLFRKMSKTLLFTDDFGRIKKIYTQTPLNYFKFPDNGETPTISFSAQKFLTCGAALAAMLVSAAAVPSQEGKIGACLLVVAATAWNLKSISSSSNAYTNWALKNTLLQIATVEDSVEHFFRVSYGYKDLIPEALNTMIHAFNNQDQQLKTYRSDGKIYFSPFYTYHDAVCKFYKELGAKAGLL